MQRLLVTFFTVLGIFILSSCEQGVPSDQPKPVADIHEELYTKETKPIPLDDDMRSKFEGELARITDETGLEVNNMDASQINKAARYLGYFGQPGRAIELYETALQKEEFQGYLSVHHNLGRLYEDIAEYNLALERYGHLLAIGHNNYQRDIDRVQKKLEG